MKLTRIILIIALVGYVLLCYGLQEEKKMNPPTPKDKIGVWVVRISDDETAPCAYPAILPLFLYQETNFFEVCQRSRINNLEIRSFAFPLSIKTIKHNGDRYMDHGQAELLCAMLRRYKNASYVIFECGTMKHYEWLIHPVRQDCYIEKTDGMENLVVSIYKKSFQTTKLADILGQLVNEATAKQGYQYNNINAKYVI